MPKQDKTTKMPNDSNEKEVENKATATLDEISKTTQNEKVDDDANKQVETKSPTDANNKKLPAIVNLSSDMSKILTNVYNFI